MKKTSLSIIIITLFIFLPILRISAHSTLLDIDYEDYLNGTLIFRNINDDVM